MGLLSEQERSTRVADARHAAENGHGLRWLAERWSLTRAGACTWIRTNIDADIRDIIAETYRAGPNIDLELGARMEMVGALRELGWSDAKIAAGIGVTPGALSTWLKRNAPDGLEAALAELRDDDFQQRESEPRRRRAA